MLAQLQGISLNVLNLSLSSDVEDLLGGWKPIDIKAKLRESASLILRSWDGSPSESHEALSQICKESPSPRTLL